MKDVRKEPRNGLSGKSVRKKWKKTGKRKTVVKRNKSVNNQKALILNAALSSSPARAALAALMLQPLRRAINYASIGRKLLPMAPLSQGAMKDYYMEQIFHQLKAKLPIVIVFKCQPKKT